MLSFKQYISEDVTYEQWCFAMDTIGSLDEGILDTFAAIPASVKGIVASMKDEVSKMVETLKVDIKDVITALKEPHIFKLLKAVKFSVAALYRAYTNAYNVIIKGIFKVFEEIHKNKIVQKIHQGTMKIDEVLNRYPLLKKLSGPIIAGLLLYIWLNMSFIGDLNYDMDLGDMIAALKGNFSLSDLFTSQKGIMLLTLFGTGMGFGLSAPWLGKTAYNMTLALVYTGLKYAKTNSSTINKIKQAIGAN